MGQGIETEKNKPRVPTPTAQRKLISEGVDISSLIPLATLTPKQLVEHLRTKLGITVLIFDKDDGSGRKPDPQLTNIQRPSDEPLRAWYTQNSAWFKIKDSSAAYIAPHDYPEATFLGKRPQPEKPLMLLSNRESTNGILHELTHALIDQQEQRKATVKVNGILMTPRSRANFELDAANIDLEKKQRSNATDAEISKVAANAMLKLLQVEKFTNREEMRVTRILLENASALHLTKESRDSSLMYFRAAMDKMKDSLQDNIGNQVSHLQKPYSDQVIAAVNVFNKDFEAQVNWYNSQITARKAVAPR